MNLRRARTAAAAAPNRIVIGGAGTGVPLLPLEEELEELLLDDDEDELLLDEELELVELVILPVLEPIPLLLDEEEDDDELLELDELLPPELVQPDDEP